MNTVAKRDYTSVVTKVFVALTLALALCYILQPIISYAGIGDVNVTIGNNGSLTVNGGGMDYSDSASAWNAFISKYKNFIVGIAGMGTVTMIGVFLYNFMKLGTTSTNPTERSKVLQGLIWSGIASAGLGSVTLIVGFFYGTLKD